MFVEYAKAGPEDILDQDHASTIVDPNAAQLDVLPTLWFRNTWSWSEGSANPRCAASMQTVRRWCAPAMPTKRPGHPTRTTCTAMGMLRCCSPTTKRTRCDCGARRTSVRYVKDGINECVVNGVEDAVNPAGMGTKAAARYQVDVEPGQPTVIRLRLTSTPPGKLREPFGDFDEDLSSSAWRKRISSTPT